jgi:hypothetical protein
VLAQTGGGVPPGVAVVVRWGTVIPDGDVLVVVVVVVVVVVFSSSPDPLVVSSSSKLIDRVASKGGSFL